MGKRKLMWIVSGLVLVILFGALNLKAKGKPDATADTGEQKAKLVTVVTVARSKAQNHFELSAALQAYDETLLSFEVPGKITELRYQEGDKVSAGAVLARVNATEYNLQLAQTNSGVNKARVGFEQAQLDFERVEQLYEAGAVSLSDYERSRDRLRVAEEDYLQAQESAGLLGQDKNSLVSPIDGTILSKFASLGQMTGAGSPVYSIGRLDPLKLVLPVPDKDLANWQVDNKVALSLYGQEREGLVTRIYPATNRGTGTVGVEVSVANPDHDWLPGQVVMAGRAQSQEGIFVPVAAVLNRGEEKPYVFLVIDDEALKRSITPGQLFGDKLEITSGLQPGDKVVVKGADQLFEGDVIEVPGGSNK